MSQSPPNYMDNVPVKISERFKPPPKISLPQSVCQRLNAENAPCLTLTYDFSLEKNVLRRIDEWKRVRESERDARRERIRKRENERLSIEKEQMKLLTTVSYPSAADLSSDDELEEINGTALSVERDTGVNDVETKIAAASAQVQYKGSQTCFDTILTPTIVPGSCNPGSFNNQLTKQNLSKINYSDFENDTSSPFDNVELKTINDLDILAQVLNVTQLHSKTSPNASDQDHEVSLSPSPEEPKDEAISNNANDIHQSAELPQPSEASENCNVTTNTITSDVAATEENHAAVRNVYEASPCLQNANHFYAAYNQQMQMQNSINMNGVTPTSDFYYYPQPVSRPIAYDNYMYSNINYPSHLIQSNRNSSSVIGATAATATAVAPTKNAVTFHDIETTAENCDDSASAAIKNKSKSVPDILRELNEEIRDSENRRIRNHSQTIESCESEISSPVADTQPVATNHTFMKLSPSSQILAKNISLMGFPLEMVSRIAERVGNDDKKIVEHLIPLSELLDLGFDESRISDALLRFDNNKEKALDFLIS